MIPYVDADFDEQSRRFSVGWPLWVSMTQEEKHKLLDPSGEYQLNEVPSDIACQRLLDFCDDVCRTISDI